MDVLYVSGMKKNLISVSTMEDKGFDITFSRGQVLMHPRGASITSAKVIGVRSGKLYRVCRGCALGKYTKFPFPASDNISTSILDLIHTDVSGRMSHVSLGGYEHYVIFIDDYSRRTWIYFLKTKDEVFSRFKDFKALVEKQIGRMIKVLRSDNGGE
eukprot:PITA_11752